MILPEVDERRLVDTASGKQWVSFPIVYVILGTVDDASGHVFAAFIVPPHEGQEVLEAMGVALVRSATHQYQA